MRTRVLQAALSALSLALIPFALTGQEASWNWPREIQDPEALIVLFQPQLDELVGNEIQGRAAVSVTLTGTENPIFGAVWLQARIETDLDERMVQFVDVRVAKVRFAEASDEEQARLAEILEKEIPTWQLEISLDSLAASLELAERASAVSEDFDDTPPIILFTEEPSILVTIEGEPQLRPLQDSGYQHVVNTPFLIVQDKDNAARFFLYAGAETWYESASVMGPWKVSSQVPDDLRQLEVEEEVDEANEEAETEAGPTTPPAVLVATEPTELIVTEGSPNWAPVGDSGLLAVSNTESDVLLDTASQKTYVLLSGRWFAATSLNGPWKFVASDELAESFSKIPPDSDEGYLLAWVAGSELAMATVLDQSIPQTAAVKRDATIEVTFDGDPQFEPIEGTSLHYAVNTEGQVLRHEDKYYAVEEAVWFVADSPKGPWTVADMVPAEFQAIPPSSPVYNVKYVKVYDSTPEVVYVGYLPGYTHSYVYRGCVVWGTGWHHSPWWGPVHFWPRHPTWGFNMRWNPWWGWSMGVGWSTGRWTFSVGWGMHSSRMWWGPAGFHSHRRGFHSGWHRGFRSGARAGYRAGVRSGRRPSSRNLYRSPTNRSRASTSPVRSGRTATNASQRSNNVFTDSSGNVSRRQDNGSWQQRSNGSWQNQASAPASRPSSGSTRSSSMNRDARARQQGSQRTRSFQSSRPSGGRRSSAGRRR